jgi:hypothetical protein
MKRVRECRIDAKDEDNDQLLDWRFLTSGFVWKL